MWPSVEKNVENFPVLQEKSVKVCQLLITILLFLMHTLFLWTGKTVLMWKKLEDDLQRQLKDAQ
jgi:hypothetical protein